jgi:C-terminal processing protease CtpA/Prc
MRLAEFREAVASHPMTPAERRVVLDHAQRIISDLYVHLAQKQALYGADPIKQLRRLARHEEDLDDPSFHREMLRIFDSLRDLHTTYVLPEPYRGQVVLGFVVESCWQDGRQRFVVTKPGPDQESPVPYLAEITHWNGVPIETAVQRNADIEAGGNAAARFARGLESLTVRNAARSPLPVEDSVYVRYVVGGQVRETRVFWMVVQDPKGLPPEIEGDPGTTARRLGYSLDLLMNQQYKAEHLRNPSRNAQTVKEWSTPYDRQFRARTIKTRSGEFGHLRIHDFALPDDKVDGFLREMRAILNEMPEKGLIVDVRANPGGNIEAAERMLGMLTINEIQPELMQFVNSPLAFDLCRQSREFYPWWRSMIDARSIGTRHSDGYPLSVVARPVTAEEKTEDKRYCGPVVLITDALAYSATDIFAAGFQDNRIGWVLGVDDNTGAGGANVWNVALLRHVWPEAPFEKLPKGSRLSFALRRSLRVGRYAGRPVEDLGVAPDVRYRMTLDDLTKDNFDLMERAGELLMDLTRDRKPVDRDRLKAGDRPEAKDGPKAEDGPEAECGPKAEDGSEAGDGPMVKE